MAVGAGIQRLDVLAVFGRRTNPPHLGVAGVAGARDSTEYPPRMAALTLHLLMGTVQREAGGEMVETAASCGLCCQWQQPDHQYHQRKCTADLIEHRGGAGCRSMEGGR